MRDTARPLWSSFVVVWMALAVPAAQAPAPDPTVYTVAYFEVAPASRSTAATLLKQYRDASRADDGLVSLDVLEQVDRPGHFVFAEGWRDQRAFDAHGAAAHTRQLLERLQPIRTSAVDQRPYKTLTVAAATARPSGQAVFVVAHVDTIPSPGSDGPGLLRRLADESRRDEGNLRFDVWQHAMRGNHFTVIEAWRDQRALDAHAAAAHIRQYRETLYPLTGSPLDERVYKVIE